MLAIKQQSIRFSRIPLKLLAVIIGLLIVGLLVYQQWEQARTVTFVIPPGTNAELAAGRKLVTFPQEVVLTIGLKDTLIIENQDDAVHVFGPFSILPHTTLTKRFKSPRVYENACTFHQDRLMRVVVNSAPWDIF